MPGLTGQGTSLVNVSTAAARSEPRAIWQPPLPRHVRYRGRARPAGARVVYLGCPGCHGRPGTRAGHKVRRVHIRRVPWARQGQGRAKNGAKSCTMTGPEPVPEWCQNRPRHTRPPDIRHPDIRHPVTSNVPRVCCYSVPASLLTAPAISNLCLNLSWPA